MKKKFLYLVLLVFTSCTYTEKYSVSSPMGDNKLIFEWVNSINPNKRGYVKIYLNNSGKDFISIRPIMDFPIHIYWGDTIKVRGGILVNADTSSGRLNWRQDYTKPEELQVRIDTTKWKHYYLNKIPEGYYK